jgi:hypothetical protein
LEKVDKFCRNNNNKPKNWTRFLQQIFFLHFFPRTEIGKFVMPKLWGTVIIFGKINNIFIIKIFGEKSKSGKFYISLSNTLVREPLLPTNPVPHCSPHIRFPLSLLLLP